MFGQNNAPNLQEIADFIEKPSQDCKESECREGAAKVVLVLTKNPEAIMKILAEHPFFGTASLLHDLTLKMRTAACFDKLGLLFDKHLADLVDACTYNLKDLGRCIDAMPITYTSKVMDLVVANEKYMKRILEADCNPEQTMEAIKKSYPQYNAQFSACRDRDSKAAPGKSKT